jgi:alkylhydroperoxidase/carboxymuconolactone decarboxylase family protein YurZ
MTDNSIDRERIKASFAESHGVWTATHEHMLRLAPAYFARYADLLAAPQRSGGLSAKVRELIGIGINASVTHLNPTAMRLHMEAALRHGATIDELIEVCCIASAMGTHTMSWGMPILVDELRKAGCPLPSGPLSPEQEEVKAGFLKERGFWKEHHEQILQLAPHYLKAYADFSAHWSAGKLTPKVRELIIIACDVSTTHLYEVGTRIHIQNALRHGASPAELTDVFVVTSLLGLQASDVGFAVIAELAEDKTGRKE